MRYSLPMKKIQLLSLLSLGATMLYSCGNGPHLDKVEKSASAFGGGKNPIALVEIKKAIPQESYGAPVEPEKMRTWENKYCTGFLISDGTVITGAECVRVAGNGAAAAAENVKVYFRNPTESNTSNYSVRKVRRLNDDTKSYAILDMEESKKLSANYGYVPMANEIPSLEKLTANLSGVALRVGSLSKTRTAPIELFTFPILTSIKVDAIRNSILNRLSVPKDKTLSAQTNGQSSTATNPPSVPQAKNPTDGTVSDELAKQVQAALALEYSGGFQGALLLSTQMPYKTPDVSEGAPILIDGICYGLLAIKPAAVNTDGSPSASKADITFRMQWLVGEPGFSTLVTVPVKP